MQIEIPNIEFIEGIDFDIIKSLPFSANPTLVVFDDSCEENHSFAEFTKLATAGRHQNIHFIYIKIKHNLFYESTKGRDAELQLTHIIFFQISSG